MNIYLKLMLAKFILLTLAAGMCAVVIALGWSLYRDE